jgi:hypothetical protein
MAWFGEEFDNYKPFGDGINDHEYLAVFDAMVHKKIREGFYLESMAVNPQIRCAIKMFGRSIANRERARRQTDRQTDENKVEVNSINDASERNEDEAEDEESTSSVDSSASEGSSEESSE